MAIPDRSMNLPVTIEIDPITGMAQGSAGKTIQLSVLSRYQSDLGAEISAYDRTTQRLFVVTGGSTLEVIDLRDPANPVQLQVIDLGANLNSVAISRGLVAVAAEAEPVTDQGKVIFLDVNGKVLNRVPVGAMPDMITFTPDGQTVITANEGEPDGGVDPLGSVSMIDLNRGVNRATVRTIDFRAFQGQEARLTEAGVRLFPNQSVAVDLEPEYITVAPNSQTAWVSLQEANTIAAVDLRRGVVTNLLPLGLKDHSLPGNGLDASDRDEGINIQNWPVFGMYMPDAIASYSVGGQTYVVTANEGDARDEEARVKDLQLDPNFFPTADTLQTNGNLGRLTVSNIDGDLNGDGSYEQLFAYGARSFSIFDTAGNRVFDSGDQFEQITAQLVPNLFNADDGLAEEFDARSDNKGPEPEGLVLGEIRGETYAFIGLERTGGVMVYNISDPINPSFVQYLNTTDGLGGGDIAPEGLTFIAQPNSPTGNPLLVVANEVSGSITVFDVNSLLL